MFAVIRSIATHLPEATVSNQQLSEMFPEWSAEKILDKTGIELRHVAAPHECASDLAVVAARKLFANGSCTPDMIDYILFCTLSPDYVMPTTGCLLQDRLGIPMHAGALDYNLGCSGYVYGLSLAKGLVESGQAGNVLLLTADTVSRYLHPQDRSTRSLMGDAATATLVQAAEGAGLSVGPFVFGTDGRGGDQLIMRNGGARHPHRDVASPLRNGVSPDYVYMNGPDILSFALRVVPESVHRLLRNANVELDAVDHFVFHQANAYILENLRDKLEIPSDKFVMALRDGGNTSASSIPLALDEIRRQGLLKPGMLVMVVAFGVGYSWGAALVRVTS